MASFMRDEDIENQLISDSDVENSDGDVDDSQMDYGRQKQQYKKLKVTQDETSEISDKPRTSRKRKANTELIYDKPSKKMCSLQSIDSPPISPVRRSKPSKYHYSPCQKKQSSPHIKENSINQCSPNKANSNRAAVKNLFSPKKKPLKMYLSPSSKRNEWKVTKSPKRNNRNGNDNNFDTFDQASDSENEDRNNTTSKNTRNDLVANHDTNLNNSPTLRKTTHHNSIPFGITLDKEISVNLPKLVISVEQKLCLDSPSKNGGPLKNEATPTKVKQEDEYSVSPVSPSRKSNRLSTKLTTKESTNGIEVMNVERTSALGMKDNIATDESKRQGDERRENNISASDRKTVYTNINENSESPTTPSKKSNRLTTKLTGKDCSSNGIDILDIETTAALRMKDNFATDESKHQVDERRQNNASTPDRKITVANINGCTQSSSQKSNPGSPSNVNSLKVSTPLQKRAITVITPISNKRTGRSVLTPSMAKRAVADRRGSGGPVEDALDATRRLLHVSTVPSTLPCREQEFDQIKSFLTKKIEHCAGGCMYISGVPGTGKTATVHAVIRYLQDEVEREEVPDFDFVEINGLRLTEPKQAYVRILQSLTDQKQTAEQAQQTLNKRFRRKSGKVTVILVDELDYLCNRRQDVVYNILEWPSGGGGGVVVVAISNTMDLPERALKGRVTSRMGLTRLAFRPYTHKQLQLIVTQRLADHPDAFHPDAIQFVARKVAAVSGDARRALDICRRTTELVHVGEQVTPAHVERALQQIFSGPRILVIRRLCRLAQLVLRALRDTAERTGVEETTVSQMYKHLVNICQLEGAVLTACVSLAGLGLVVGEKRRPDITRKLCLNVSSDDIHYALDNKDATAR